MQNYRYGDPRHTEQYKAIGIHLRTKRQSFELPIETEEKTYKTEIYVCIYKQKYS